MTFEQAMVAAVISLAGVIGTMGLWFKVLYYKQEKRNEQLDRRLVKCEEDRINLWKQIATLSGQKCDVSHCPKRHVPTRPDPADDDGA